MNDFESFLSDVQEESLIRGMTPHEIFFERFSEISTERGDGPDFTPCTIFQKTKNGTLAKLDGYAFEQVEAEKKVVVTNVYLVSSYYDQQFGEPNVIKAADVDNIILEVTRAAEVSMTDDFLTNSTDQDAVELGLSLRELTSKGK